MNCEIKTMVPIMKYLLLMVFSLIAVLSSCDGTGPTALDRDVIIVQGNLVAGKPVDDIRLFYLVKSIVDSGEGRTYEAGTWVYKMLYTLSDRPIMDALVTISGNGGTWQLTHSDSGWYYEPSGELLISTGKTYRIDVHDSYGRHVWAETTVPDPVTGLTKSKDTMYVDTAGSGEGSSGGGSSGWGRSGASKILFSGRSGTGTGSVPYTPAADSSSIPDSLSRITLRWNRPEEEYIFFNYRMELSGGVASMRRGMFTNTPGLVLSNTYIASGSGSGSGSQSESGNESDSIRRSLKLEHPGVYTCYVHSPPPGYWKMLVERPDTGQAIQDRWTRAFTNVIGGTGYFVSFGLDSITIVVAPWKEE